MTPVKAGIPSTGLPKQGRTSGFFSGAKGFYRPDVVLVHPTITSKLQTVKVNSTIRSQNGHT